jgi:hypothetical protein
MSRTTRLWRRPGRRQRPLRARLEVELLEVRNLLSSTLGLTPLVQVSDPNPLPTTPPPPPPTVFIDSEVEPQIAVDPTNTAHAVAIWQQDRFRSVGGARALVVSVTYNANDSLGATWSTPAAIPGFNSTDPAGAAFPRYTDPWVSFTPTGDLYASAIALTPGGPFPSHTAVLVVKSTDGGSTWSTPTTLIDTQAPPGTDPIDLANDKEMVTADPTDPTGQTVYVVWDRIDHPSDQQNFNAFHSSGFREDALFSRTTDGGVSWSTPQDLTNFKMNVSALGNEIVVEPDGTVIDVFPALGGSNNQPPQAAQNHVAVVRSTDKGVTWSDVITGPAIEQLPVSDPDTGAAVRAGETLTSATVDPSNGNLYVVWADGRFSGFTHDDIAFSMSTDGGLTWSAPIKVNQTPTNIPAGNQQAFTPTVAVNSAGTVAVTYYDFRNNTADPGLPTDYWLVHASSNLTNPASWASDEKRLTDTSFNMENAAPTSRGYFLGDYNGLAAAGNNFYALFAQAGSGASDPSNIWFRDPPPAPDAAEVLHAAGDAVAAQPVAKHLGADDLAGTVAALFGKSPDTTGWGQATEAVGRSADWSPTAIRLTDLGAAVVLPFADAGLALRSGGFGEMTALDAAFAGLGDSPFANALADDAVSPLAD